MIAADALVTDLKKQVLALEDDLRDRIALLEFDGRVAGGARRRAGR